MTMTVTSEEKAMNNALGMLKVVDRAVGITNRWYGYFDNHTPEQIYAIIEGELPAEDEYRLEDESLIVQLRWSGWDTDEYDPDHYTKYRAWVDEQLLRGDTYYYAQPRESFFEWEAYDKAHKLGKRFIILEDLS